MPGECFLVGIVPVLCCTVYSTKSLVCWLWQAWSSFTNDTPKLIIDPVVDETLWYPFGLYFVHFNHHTSLIQLESRVKWIGQFFLLSIMHGRCEQVRRCHHSLPARIMDSNMTLFVFPYSWQPFFVFHFLFILSPVPTFMLPRLTNAAPVLSDSRMFFPVALWLSRSTLHRTLFPLCW